MGQSYLLDSNDFIFGTHRSHHEVIAKGMSAIKKLSDEKLTEIIRSNDIKSVTVLRMEVPCCGGLEHAAITALKNSGKFIPWNVVTFSTDGRILDR